MAMMLMASTNPPVHWFRCRPARLTVEIPSHFENFLTKAEKLAYCAFSIFLWAHMQFYK